MGNLNTNAVINKVNDQDFPVGVVNRKDLPSRPTNFRVVHVFVLTSAGDFVLQHIAQGQRSEGQWGSSVAGYVLAGESYAAAGRRKLADELGLRSPGTLRLVGKTEIKDLGATKFMSLFQLVADGPFELNIEQVSDVRLVPPDQLEREIDAHPERFTSTFQHLWRFYRGSGS